MKYMALVLGAAFALAIAVPAAAQSFDDVPYDHWAYDAVNDLQEKGVLIGYPDGMFKGKQALTRYEFAMAIWRMIPWLEEHVKGEAGPAGPAGAAGPAGPAGAAGPKGDPGVGVEDLEKIKALVEEFKDDLANLGVEVESLKRDLDRMAKRLGALEEKIEGIPDIHGYGWFGYRTGYSKDLFDPDPPGGSAEYAYGWPPLNTYPGFGPDYYGHGDEYVEGRPFELGASQWAYDVDLMIDAVVWNEMKAHLVINIGNYVPWLATGDASDCYRSIKPWLAYVDSPVNLGSLEDATLTIGKLPLQYTPFTFMWARPDFYWEDHKWNGDYPVFGVVTTFTLGSVDFMTHAATHYGMSYPRPFDPWGGWDESVGGRAMFELGPGTMGLTGLYASQTEAAAAGSGLRNRNMIFGADWHGMITDYVDLDLEYAKFYTARRGGYRIIDNNNDAFLGSLTYHADDLALTGGYMLVDYNFATPGYWLRWGRIVNPNDLSGFFGKIAYNFSPEFSGYVRYDTYDRDMALTTNTSRWMGGVEYDITDNYTVKFDYEQVLWNPGGGVAKPTESYYTVSVDHPFNENAALTFMYQIVDWDGKTAMIPWGSNYKGHLGSAQFRFEF